MEKKAQAPAQSDTNAMRFAGPPPLADGQGTANGGTGEFAGGDNALVNALASGRLPSSARTAPKHAAPYNDPNGRRHYGQVDETILIALIFM